MGDSPEERRSTADIVRHAAHSSASWIAREPLKAALIALLLVVALGGWATAIERGRRVDGFLDRLHDLQETVIRMTEQARERDEAWRTREKELLKRVVVAEAGVRNAAAELDRIRNGREAITAPGTWKELLGRLGPLGVTGEVRK